MEKIKLYSLFQRGSEVIECLSPCQDGAKGHLFGFFRHVSGSTVPTFFGLRLGTMKKKGWHIKK